MINGITNIKMNISKKDNRDMTNRITCNNVISIIIKLLYYQNEN